MPNYCFTIKIKRVGGGWIRALVGVPNPNTLYALGCKRVKFINDQIAAIIGVIAHVGEVEVALVVFGYVFPVFIDLR